MAGERNRARFHFRLDSGAPGSHDVHLEPILRDAIEQPRTPLDNDDRPIEVDVKVVELERAGETIRIDVHERGTRRARVCAREDKGRTGHGASNPQLRAKAASQRCLARTELAIKQNEVSGAKLARNCGAQFLHGLGRRNREFGHDTKTRVTRGPILVTIS